jgi:hypothetical protein
LTRGEARREAFALADGAIKENRVEIAAAGRSRWQKLCNWFRFQSPLTAVKIVCPLFLGLLAFAFAARLLRPYWGPWSELVYLLPTAAIETFFLVYISLSMWLPDRVWSDVSSSERRELTAILIVDKWLARKLKLDDLLAAHGASSGTLKARRKILVATASVVDAFVNFFDLFVGQQISPHRGVFALLGVPPERAPAVFIACVIFTAAAAFIFILVPLHWQDQLEPFLRRAVECQKARSAGGYQWEALNAERDFA